jgi:glycosyltransferase involved in cell wall biosynthesis
MNGMPTWSIIVPTFNRPRALLRCVESLRQYAPQAEVVVVDDGSPVDLTEPLDRLHVRYVRQENRGPAAARNHGARLAQGEWLAFIDDDCLITPHWLAALEAAAQCHPQALLGGRVRNGLRGNLCAESAQVLIDSIRDYTQRNGRGPQDALAPFYTSNNLAVSCELFAASGGFDERLPLAAAEDREFCRQWQLAGRDMRFVEEAVVIHEHPLNLPKLLRQQFQYGRGAIQARRLQGGQPAMTGPEGPSFYWHLLSAHWRHRSALEAAALSGLIGLGQCAMITGAIWETFHEPTA